ncbi:MAG: magnesium chelatase domain-containing protein, partial [Actinomycetota bacterium]
QTLEDPRLEQGAGSVTQVRDCAAALVRFAKESGTAVVIVGHVTKDGSVAGPKTLEHVVDAVLMLDGERTGSMRLLRADKNRFGSCEEVGVFTMEGEGLVPVADPSAMLLADRLPGVPGSIVFPTIEGSRPVLVEMQALTPEAAAVQQARRTAIGLDSRRLSLLLGVLDERVGLKMAARDVFAAAAGGLSIREPAADLPVALALASSLLRLPVPQSVVAFGEVGLGGEVRRVPAAERRLAEAARMGFTEAIVPRGVGKVPKGLMVSEVSGLAEAVAFLTERAVVSSGAA